MQKKKVIGFILMLITILIISFGGRSTYAAGTPMLMEREGGTNVTGTGEVFYAIGAKRAGKTKYTADLISSITLVTNKNVPTNAEASWDASYTSGSNEVIAWVVKNSTDTTKYDLFIGANSTKIQAPVDSKNLFDKYTNCTVINNLTMLNTANVTNMSWMFYNCSKLTSLDVSKFNTSNVTLMGRMFSDCSKLTSLDVSNFDTSKVTKMQGMFSNCSGLTNLAVSNFNTTIVTDMSSMFTSCSKLTSLDVSNFNTQNVTNMSWMFSSCSNLTSLDLSKFNTSNVTHMGRMFSGCSKLIRLDLSNFNTSKTINIQGLFYDCSEIISLNISNFDTAKVTNMENMFYNCSNLKAIILDKAITSSNQAMKLLTNTTLDVLSKAILYVPDAASEKFYEAATNYSSIFADSRDTSGNLYRIRPILEVAGENPAKASLNGIYDEKKDAGATIAGFDKTNASEYTQYGYNCTTVGLPVDTTSVGTKQVTYTLTKTKNGTTRNGMTATRDVNVVSVPMLMEREGGTFVTGTGEVFYAIGAKRAGKTKYTADLISSITLVTNKNVPSSAEASWDASYTSGSNEVIAWVVQNSTDTTKYDLYIGSSSSNIEAPSNSEGLFRNYTNCVNINNLKILTTQNITNAGSMFFLCNALTSLDLQNFITANVTKMNLMFSYCTSLVNLDLTSFNTSNVVNMRSMFDGSKNLTSLDLSNFDTRNVTDIAIMFYGCSNLESVNLSSFDTTKVTDMYRMFFNCGKLTSLDLSNFRTPNVTNMTNMFYQCQSLTNLNVSEFDTSNVTNMSWMFFNCSNLTSLDISSFNTTNVTSMERMFNYCKKLTSLDLSNFKTPNVTNMTEMFSYCSSLTSLDLSNFRTSNVTNMTEMFYGCGSLTSLDVSNFDTQNISDMSKMFYDCSSLTSLDLTNFRTSNVTNMRMMFFNCSSLTSLNVSNFNTTNVTSMLSMFDNCRSLTNLDLSNFDTTNVTDMSNMFSECKSLTSLNLNSFNTTNVTNMGYMFFECTNLKALELENFSTSKVTDMSAMFYDCKNLESLNVSGFDTSNVTNMEGMFYGCHSLGSLDLSGFNTSNVTNMQGMFYECKKIKHLNLSGFNTSKITNMQGLFYDCSEIISLDISNFDTSKVTNMAYMFYNCSNLKSIILYKEITSSDQAMKLSTNTLLNMLPNAILYVPDTASEKLYEAATNYATTFADSRDTEGDLYRVRPILEVAGENPAKASLNGIYDEKKDAGATIAGFDKSNASEYTQYGYNYTTAGLPVDTTTKGTKKVTYTLTKTKNGTTTSGMSVTRNVNIVDAPKLMTRESYDYINGKGLVFYAIGAKRSGNTKYTSDLISTITFVNNVNVPAEAEASWDASYTSGDNEVIAWVVKNSTDTTKYDLFIGADVTTIEAPIDSGYLFMKYTNCTAINNLTMLNTTKAINLRAMFSGCENLTVLDVSNFDTAKVTNMYAMFSQCKQLTSLDLNNFNTTNVTSMGDMFFYCSKLTNLDLSNFNTTNVTYMSNMFYNCEQLTSLDLSNFDTSKVTNMSKMFYNCEQLTSLDLSNFDTSKVTDMNWMFSNCHSLTSLDVSKFNTSNVTNMSYMFYWCRNLTSLDVSKFNTSNVTDMSNMFYWCSNLTSLDVSDFNTSNVTNMSCMFGSCSKLTILDVSGFDTSKVKSMGFMFNYCTNLKNIDLRSFDTSSLDGETYNMPGTALGVDINYMFSYCGNLESIIIGDKFNRLDGYDMFKNCNKLKAIITTKTITTSSDAPTLSGTENVTNSDGEIIAGPNGLVSLPDAILYVPDTASEKFYEAATNYATVFADSRDANGDLYRVRPILEVAGDNPVKVKIGETYDATVDAGATIAGFDKANASEYTQYGYDYTTVGLPVDTTVIGTKQVTYTLTKTENGTTTNGMTATRDVKVVGVPMLMNRREPGYIIGAKRSGNTKYTADLVSTITFVSNTNIPTTAEASWDASYTSGDNEVIAWVIPNATDSTKYDLFIGANDTAIKAPVNSGWLLAEYTNCTAINNLTMLDTSNVMYMAVMFRGCSELASLDVSSFDTSKVTNMSWMFYGCGNLTSLDLSSFNTSKVTDMTRMFYNCSNLTELNVSNFDTSNVTNMSNMFFDCKQLTSLDLSNFYTNKITNMDMMFYNCSNLTSLNVSNFDTNKITNMSFLFYNCRELTSLNLSNFDTSNVTKMQSMFSGCNALTSLDISNFDTTNVTNMSSMFDDCSKLISLDISNFNTTNVTNMSHMFYNCSNLTSLDVSNFDTSKVTNMSFIFYWCSNLTSLDVSNFNTSNVTNMGGMFSGCSNLTSLDVSRFDTSKVKTMGFMFDYCTNLKNIDLRSFDTSSLDGETYNLTTTALGVDVNYMFSYCGNLESIIIGDKFNRLDGYDMFRGCNKLKAIITTKTITTSSDAPTLSGTENVTNSNGKIIAGPNELINLPNAILYAPDAPSEKLYEAATNYSTVFADSGDVNGDLYRIRPILEVAGENPVKVKIGETYDATVDAGATIAGFTKAESSEYTQYGYNYTTAGLPLNTSAIGTKQVTYTLTKTENGTTTNGMTTTRTVNVVELPKLMEREKYDYINGKGFVYYAIGAKRSGNKKYTADLISTITFVNNTNIPTTAEANWDASYTNGDNEVIAWVIPNTTDSTKYDLYIGADDTSIQAPANSVDLFSNYTNCTEINNLEMLDTSNVTDMDHMFYNCRNLTSLDLSSFNTSNVINMSNMFYMCRNLTSLDLSSFNTSNVTDMNWMFSNCINLTSLDLSSFNTSNVINMSCMFYWCSNLTSLDVSKFDTSNVTNIRRMFGDCSNLTSLDVSKFDTSNVTNMDFMFSGCSKLTSLDVSKFDTSKVTDMSWMFSNCSQLTSLDVNNFNTTNVTSMDGMFSGCSKLTSLDVSGFDTSKVKTMGFMFNNCNSLKNIDLRSFDTSSLDGETNNIISTALGVDVNYMFWRCENLESIIIGDKFNRLDGYEMFDGCNKLKAIITTKTITASSDAPTLSGTENVTNSNGEIIAGPNGLIDLPNAILYAPDTASEKLYEAATNYATTFADSRDTEGDLYRIRPILEVAGENPVKVKIGETYDATVDAGATIAGFGVTDSGEYTQYGYNYTTVGLPVDTTTKGTKQVTYTLTKTKNGTTNGMTTTRTVNVVGVPMLMKREDSAYIIGAKRSGNTKYTADLVSTITFVSNTNIPTTAEASWDVSYTNGDGEVIAWVIPNATDSTKYDLFIGANNETLQAPINSNHLFGEYTNCTAINNLTMLDTSSVTYMSTMFYWCINLTSLDVSNFNTTNVTNMGGMFLNCSKLTSLDVSKFDTSKVTDMGMMFFHCSSLTNLDVSNFDTSNVTDIESMFYYCNKLASLDVSNFDTSKVTNMDGMFYNCNKLPSLDVSKFNTSNVTSMSNMFYDCGSLTNLDVSKFDTSKVANMSYMFYGCRSLTSLDVSKFDTSKVTNMNYMFYACNSLKSLDVSSFNTSLVTKMSNMFDGCSGLTSLDISNFNTSKVTDMGMMFSYCSSLTNLDVSNFDTSNVTDMSYMFWSCSNLVSLDVNNFDTSKVTNMESIFSYCSSLTHLNVSNFNTSSVKEMSSMFTSCIKLTSLDVSNFDTSNVTSMRYMFWNCNSLISVDISNFDTSKVTNMEYMFNDCSKLKAIILDKSITASSQAMKLSTGTSLENLPNAILYVHDTASEKLYEAATNYSTVFADSRDANGDLYRIRPILEVAGDNPAKVSLNGIYDETKDAGATIAGFGVTDSGEYTQYGYNYATSGLPVDTTSVGTKQVTYTLTKTKNGTTTNGMTATRDVKVTEAPKLMERDYDTINGIKYANYAIGAKRAGKTKYKKDLISTITLVSNKNVPTTAEASWDVSYTNGSNEVIAWVIPNATDSTKYDLYIGADDTSIQAPANSVDLFSNYTNCTEINNLEMLDTSKVTSMMYMFHLCNNLTKVNVSNFDTSKVTTMYGMFGYCSKLTSLDVSKFNTSNVTNMFAMFGSCSSLTNLDVTNFDTSKVTSMLCMFTDCRSLTSLDVSNFNTSNVTDMKEMFSNCRSLKELDLSSFDTSKVTTMNSMLSNCGSLTNLNVSSFNTSKVTDMSLMFASCSSLTNLDVSNFNTSNVTTFAAMFSTCSSLENLNLATFDTRNARTIGFMFYNCSSLTNVVVTGTNFRFTKLDHTTAGITGTYESLDINCVFAKCSSLTGIDLSSWNITASENMNELFADCTNLKSIVLGRNFAALKGADMFKNCDNLRAIITKRTTPLTLATGTGAETLGVNNPKVLYVETKQLESSFESASNYASVFGANRIRPILEVAGDNPAKVSLNGIYDETKDAGATIAGFTKAESSEYTQYGYNYTTAGLPLNTSAIGTKQVTYTLRKTENGTTTNGMTTTRTVNVVGLPKLMERETYDYINNQYVYYVIGAKRSGNKKYTADLISTITFVANKNVPSTAEASWDVSYTKGNNEVIAWVIQNATDNTKYDLYIGADDTKIQAPANSTNLFERYENCTAINNLSMLDTSNVTNMSGMFFSCSALTSLDVSNFDTSKVTTMAEMFHYCINLTSLDLNNFDTTKVTDMKLMFWVCRKLTNLDVSNFNTSNVTDMRHMFYYCSSLTNLDVSNFDTSKVTDMSYMFASCSGLTSLDVTNFNTSKVTTMLNTFNDCSSLTSLNVSNFNTSNVTDMKEMFADCSSLTSLDLSNFNTSKVTTMMRMFSNCFNLTDLNIGSFNTSKVTDMSLMFASCRSLINLDLSNFNTSNVINMSVMFSTCRSLESLNLAHFDTRNAKTIGFMFYNCTSLKNLIVTGTNFTFTKLDHTTAGIYPGKYKAVDINGVFEKCSSLTSLDLSSWNITTSENMNELFADCTNLKSIVLGRNFATLKGADMFKNCDNLRAIITKRTTPLTLATGTGAETLGVNNPKVLYVETKQLESSFESASNYASVFGANRIRPILGVAGDNPAKVNVGGTYDSSVDAGATIAGFGVTDSGEYTQYGYNYTTAGLPLNTSAIGTKQVTYTLTKTENGTTTNGMTATRTVNVVGLPKLMERETGDNVNGNIVYYAIGAKRSGNTKYTSDLISTITFVNNTNIPTTAEASWDASYTNGDNEVIAWVMPNTTDSTKYDLYIGFDNTIIQAPKVSENLFRKYTNCTIINNLTMLDTSNVTDMSYMFYNCSQLTSLDVSKFDTSKVINMSWMFYYCSNLTSLNLSSFNTSNVTTMYNMFAFCSNLTSLDVSKFDTSNVTNMVSMFADCSKLTSLDVSKFDTSNVTNMSSMFYGCSKLTSLDVSNFNTSNVTYMGVMFNGCSNLTSLDVSKFNTSNVTNMNAMFESCRSLTSLDVTNFDTSKVTDLSIMFDSCRSLSALDVSSFDTSNVTSMDYMFYGCSNLTSLDVSSFDTSNVVFMSYMFYGCSKLKAIILDKSITASSQAMKLSTGTSLENLPNAILYVPDTASEKLYEAAKNYSTVFADSRDANGDLYRIRPILEVAGENPAKVSLNGIYDETKDAGATIAGFTKAESSEYTQYGYNYTTAGLPLNTSAIGTKQVTYTLRKTENGTTTNGMTTTRTVNVVGLPKLMERETYDYINNQYVYYVIGAKRSGNKKYTADLISTITFVANKNVPSTAEASWDVSYTKGNNEVIAWVIQNATDNTKYDLYIGADDTKIQAPANSTNLFERYENCTAINNLSMLDTSKVTKMVNMFSQCSSLTSLDVSTFDTSKVTDMSAMFSSCSSLTSLDLSNFNTSKVTDMNRMFSSCSSLTNVDLSGFNTSSATNMECMFALCIDLTSVDVSNFDTSKVTTMKGMFYLCSSLTSLDLSNFNTSKVTDMDRMFSSCSSLTSLDLSSWNITASENMNELFAGCTKLRSIVLGKNFTALKGADMFKNCDNLRAIITKRTTPLTLATGTGAETVGVNNPKVLYVETKQLESSFESASNYASVFGADRICPILGVAGENPVKVNVGGTYDSSVDAGATIAGFGVADSGEYTQYGYNYTTSGLPLNTSAIGTKQVTYTLTKTENGTTTNGMTATRTVNVVGLPKLMERETGDNVNGNIVYYAIGAKRSGNTKYTSDLISTITFVNNTNIPTTAEASWDASYTNGDNEVIAWVIPNVTDSIKYDLYIGTNDTTIQAPANSNRLFGYYKICTAIDNLKVLDNSNVINMEYMFYGCNNLTNLDASNFDTTNVTNMRDMFEYCYKLTKLDVSKFNTSKVTNMSGMFNYCNNLTSLDVGNFDTSKVTNMNWMFSNCSKLADLDASSFDTSKVTDMSSMFSGCSKLISLDVSNFDTTNVTKMSSMFSFCNNLTSLDLSNFNTSKVTDMSGMFRSCSSLTSLDISDFDTTNVTNMCDMFEHCYKLTKLDVSKFNTSKVTNMSGMFDSCSSLTSLDVSGFDTSKVKSMGWMFSHCTNLKNIDLRSFDTSSLDGKTHTMSSPALGVDVNYMFSGCGNLESIIIGDKFNRLDGYDMFRGCNKLKAIITTKTITISSDAPTLSGTENVTNSNGEIIAGPNGLINLPDAILYVPDTASEKLYEAATNYATIFADSRDTEGDLYRIRPILEVDGENPVKVKIGETYDATVDAGATIAGFGVTDSGEYTQYGYNYTTAGLPVDTTTKGTKQVTYTLTKTKDGTTTNGMTATRDVEIVAADITGSVSISGDCVYGETLIVDTSKILPENADLEYKWYINDTNSTTGGTLVKEANSDSGLGNRYFISGDAIDKYVYVEVTASLENYTTKTFTDVVGPVQRADINRVDASLIHDIFVYDGNPKEPEVYVVDLRGPGDLTLGEDYTLEYKDNVNVGTGKVIVKGINKYTGELELTFKIIKAPEFELVNLTPEWTTSNVSIAINILDVGAGIKKVLFENEEVTLQKNTTTVVVDKNGLYTAEVFDIYGNAVVKELYVGNIDREVPVIEEVKHDGVTFAKEVKVEVKATDTGSGVYAYAVSEKDAEPTTWTQITPVENMTIFNFTISSNGTYYLFVKDAVGNITKYNKQIIITNIDNAPPVIKLFNIIDDYTFTTEVFIEINAEDDTGVEGLLLSNEMLTNSQVEDSDNWVPYTETVLYSLPSKDGNHTVYAWVRDSVGKISEYAQDNTLLLNKYVGNNGINNTSFKFLVKDENYNFAKKITESNIKILVKDDSDRVTYSTEYGVNITSISLPVVYGPAQEGTQMMTGEYYTITVENIGGEGTVYLVFDENSVVDKAGNKLANKEIKTDVEVELNTPKITLGTTEIQVSDPDGNLIQAIKVNGKTVLLTSGKITYEKLKTEYGITLKTDDTIEAFDKHSNSVMVTVQ